MRIKDGAGAPAAPAKPAETRSTSSLPSEASEAVQAYSQTGAHVALESVPKALDGFLGQNPAELKALRDVLKASPEGLRELAGHQQDNLWKGPATADKVVKILAGSVDGNIPTTPKEAAALLSDALGETHSLYAERDAVLRGRDPLSLSGPDRAKLEAVEVKLSTVLARTETLRAVHCELEGVKRLNHLEATGVMLGFSLGTGVPGIGGGSAEVGFGVKPEDRKTSDRKVYPYASVGVGLPMVGGGYTWSKEPGRSGKGVGFSVPFVGFTQDAQHGKRLSAFIPNVASFQMTERGEIGFSFAVPVFPFVQVGVSCFVENPAIARITGPLVRGIEKVIGPPVRGIKRIAHWVNEHVIHRAPEGLDAAAVPA